MQPLTQSLPHQDERIIESEKMERKILMGWGIFIGKAKAMSTSKGNQLSIQQFRDFAACSVFTVQLVLSGFNHSVSGRACVVLIFFRRLKTVQ